MTKKEAIESIKNATKAIGLLFYEAEKVEDFVAEKVKDGSQEVSIEGEFVPGTLVNVSSAMGSVPAPDDTYVLSSGVEFSTKAGKIDKVIKAPEAKTEEAAPDAEVPAPADAPAAKTAEAAPAAAPAAAPEVETPAPEVAPAADNTAAIATLVQKITELDTMINTIKTALEGKASAQAMSALGEQFTAIKGAFEVLSNTPAEFSKVDTSIEAKEDKANKLNALASVWTKN